MNEGAVARAPRLSGQALGRAASLLLPIGGGIVLGLTTVCFLAQPVWGDQSWFLYAASRVLDGARIGIDDLVEVNPPLIIWISEIAVWLGRVTGLRPQAAMEICLAALFMLSLGWCFSLARRAYGAGSDAFAWWVVVLLLFVVGVYPWRDYAQREHLLVLAVMPYLFMAAARLDGTVAPVWEAVAAGLLAAAGISLKPYNLLVLLGVEALVAYRTRLHSLIRPEILALVAAGAAYCVTVWLLTPDYVSKLLPILYDTYRDYMSLPIRQVALSLPMAKIAAVIVAWSVVRRRLRFRTLVSLFIMASVAAAAGFVMQHKDIEYQFLPAKLFIMVAAGLMLVDLFLQWSERRPARLGLRRATVVVVASALAAAFAFYPFQAARAPTVVNDHRTLAQMAITAKMPEGTAFYILSPSNSLLFDMVLEHRLMWAGRFAHLWMLEAIFQAERKGVVSGKLASHAQWARIAVAEDLRRWRPEIVLVDHCEDLSFEPCISLESLRVDLLEWFMRDPTFASAWSNYVPQRRVGPYEIWCAKAAGSACQHLLASSPATAQ